MYKVTIESSGDTRFPYLACLFQNDRLIKVESTSTLWGARRSAKRLLKNAHLHAAKGTVLETFTEQDV